MDRLPGRVAPSMPPLPERRCGIRAGPGPPRDPPIASDSDGVVSPS